MRKVLKPILSFPQNPYNSPLSVRQNLQNQIFNNKKINESLELLNLLNSETRLQIITTLDYKRFLCVSDISDILRISISAVSHQLKILRHYKIVRRQKKGKVVYYSLEKNLPAVILAFIEDISV